MFEILNKFNPPIKKSKSIFAQIKNMKKTIVLGASTNPERYSYKAIAKLKENGFPVVPVGLKEGEVMGEKILTGMPQINDVHTVTLYVGEKNQKSYYQYILGLNPKRIIFNPGAENSEFSAMASAKGIEVMEACTLVLLSLNNF